MMMPWVIGKYIFSMLTCTSESWRIPPSLLVGLSLLIRGLSMAGFSGGHVDPAGCLVFRADGLQRRVFDGAALDREHAARAERAAFGERHQVRRQAFDRRQLRLAPLVQARDRVEQPQR